VRSTTQRRAGWRWAASARRERTREFIGDDEHFKNEGFAAPR
jgi:hypothetical protein